MHLIDGQGHNNNAFRPADYAAGEEGSEVTADWLNSVQEELANFITHQGLTLDKSDNTQLTQALLLMNYSISRGCQVTGGFAFSEQPDCDEVTVINDDLTQSKANDDFNPNN